jgi:hypothetical protein
MRCEECLPLVEEYVDGELKSADAEQVTAHLSLCATCAGEVDELVREQEMYANYRRELEVTPAMWNVVRARIEDEKAAQHDTVFNRLQTWFAGSFATGFPLRAAMTAALIFIALGITTVGLIKYLNRRQPTVASKQEQVRETQQTPKAAEASVLDKANANETTLARNPDERVTPDESTVNSDVSGQEQKKVFIASGSAASSSRADKRRQAKPSTDDAVQPVEADDGNFIANVTRDVPAPLGDAESEIASHVEKAQMLLRSFRNVRLAETSHAPDVAYEKEQSRKLLYRNIILRREAMARGNAPAEKLLGTLEPILLDIANLPDRATARDVRNIERRMQKKEIVATLQIHSLIAANSY